MNEGANGSADELGLALVFKQLRANYMKDPGAFPDEAKPVLAGAALLAAVGRLKARDAALDEIWAFAERQLKALSARKPAQHPGELCNIDGVMQADAMARALKDAPTQAKLGEVQAAYGAALDEHSKETPPGAEIRLAPSGLIDQEMVEMAQNGWRPNPYSMKDAPLEAERRVLFRSQGESGAAAVAENMEKQQAWLARH